MNTLLDKRRAGGVSPLASDTDDPHARTPFFWLGVVSVLALGLYLLFCHGCHGDEDNELFTSRTVKTGVR